MDIVLASNNEHKVAEIKEKLSPLGITVFSLRDKQIVIEIEEHGSSFRENALIKAETIYRLTGIPVLGDDSGLVVDALEGRPGVYSARFAGENATDEQNIDKLLVEMAGIPVEKRGAAFECCMAFVSDDGSYFFDGRCEGRILDERCGENGFGYDPVFYLDQLEKSMAQLSMSEKNRVSHRAKALEAFVRYAAEELA